MKEAANKEGMMKEKKMKKGTKIFLIILSILAALLFIWSMVVACWPVFTPSFAVSRYEEDPSSSLVASSYVGEDILSSFSITPHAKSHLHWTGLFSNETRHHYEFTLSSSRGVYFRFETLSVTASYGEGGSFEIPFEGEGENLLSSYGHVSLTEEIDVSSFTYSVSSTSLITIYSAE